MNQLALFDKNPIITKVALNANPAPDCTPQEWDRFGSMYKVRWLPKKKFAWSGTNNRLVFYCEDPQSTFWVGGLTLEAVAETVEVLGLVPEA